MYGDHCDIALATIVTLHTGDQVLRTAEYLILVPIGDRGLCVWVFEYRGRQQYSLTFPSLGFLVCTSLVGTSARDYSATTIGYWP